MNWNGWPLERILLLLIGLAFILLFIQVTLFHYRQNFRSWPMWIPVIETPLFGLTAIVFSFYYAQWLITILGIFLVIGTLSGLSGLYYHVKGIGDRVGGYTLNNFLIGPPPTLPVMMSALSVVGLVALYWR